MVSVSPVRRSIRRRLWYVALATTAILVIPLLLTIRDGGVEGVGWNWTFFDFVFMGVLLFGSGLTYVLISRLSDSKAYRFAVGIAVATGLLLIWGNAAAGIIGSEGKLPTVLYVSVPAVGFICAFIARFRPRGMARALFATALAQALVPLIALIFWRPAFDEPPGMVGVFILNALFIALFVTSALLFRRASATDPA
ncbi:MAG TPA: hypothetical protein VGL38_01095 [bacterium]|jgi:hypothetical protein